MAAAARYSWLLLPGFTPPHPMSVRIALFVVVLWSVGGAAAQPAPERPSDDLLTRPALQAVVEAQAVAVPTDLRDRKSVV